MEGKFVIFNADDFGLTEGINRGIEETIFKGVVRSVSVLTTVEKWREICGLVKRAEEEGVEVSVGCHLSVTRGAPLTSAGKLFARADGEFHTRWADMVIDLSSKGVETTSTRFSDALMEEFEAQLSSLKGLVRVTHLDVHHHLHVHDEVFGVVAQIALRHRLPVRSPSEKVREQLKSLGIPTPDRFEFSFFDEPSITYDGLLKLLDGVGEGITEFGVHPGEDVESLAGLTSYWYQRGIERKTLTRPELLTELEKRGIRLVSYWIFHGSRE